MPASTPASRPTRRTRIVCVSDTHNSTAKLPKGDVLIHAGDLTNQGSYSELLRAVQWLEKADFEAKIVVAGIVSLVSDASAVSSSRKATAGNHDITLDREFYLKHGLSFHNQSLQDSTTCMSLLTSSHTITYLQHDSASIRLSDPKGPGTEFTVFGSPYSPECGTWAFGYCRSGQTPDNAATMSPNAAELWAAIPLDTDILVTHTPPQGHCDSSLGCEELRRRLASVRPRLHVCGHVHQGRGAERVRWNRNNDEATEASVEPWEDPNPDPSSAKISLVDLTARGGKRPLDFGETTVSPVAHTPPARVPCALSDPPPDVSASAGPVLPDGREDETETSGIRATGSAIGNSWPELGMDRKGTAQPSGMDRAGRRETCVVNCAITATSWPHMGGKRFNKPIVVDVDLPVRR